MTEQTGSSNKETDVMPPWERKWNDTKDFVGKTIDSVVDTTKKAVGSVQMPWERSWGSSVSVPPTEAPRPSPTPYKPMFDTEKQMIKAVQFTPEELKRHAVEMRSPESIKELKEELSRTTNPKVKQILEKELIKLTRR